MKYFKVPLKVAATVNVIVKVESKEEARELAMENCTLDTFAGNGGVDKLIGVNDINQTIEADDFIQEPQLDSIEEVTADEYDDSNDEEEIEAIDESDSNNDSDVEPEIV
jgi:hypothetical protein